MGDKIKVAVIGCGGIAHCHARAADQVGVPLQALCDVSAEARQRFGDQYGVEGRYASVEEMMAHEELDIAVICTWGVHHAQVSEQLARSGRVRAILCEKPICSTTAECEGMIEIGRAHV